MAQRKSHTSFHILRYNLPKLTRILMLLKEIASVIRILSAALAEDCVDRRVLAS